MGERPISQPKFAGTHTPDPKKRLVEAMPTPQGIAKEFRPGSWSHGEPAAARSEKPRSAIVQALALEPPVEGQLTRALENYEDYHGLDRGTATVNDLRTSKHSMSTWAHYDLAGMNDAHGTGGAPKLVGKIPYSTTWRAELASFLKCAIQDPRGYREVAVCENATGDTTFNWGDDEYALGAVPQQEDFPLSIR